MRKTLSKGDERMIDGFKLWSMQLLFIVNLVLTIFITTVQVDKKLSKFAALIVKVKSAEAQNALKIN